MIKRRAFLTGLIGIIASPAIVRASSLMPIKVIDRERETTLRWFLQPIRRHPGYEMLMQYQYLRTDTLRAMLDQSSITDLIRGTA